MSDEEQQQQSQQDVKPDTEADKDPNAPISVKVGRLCVLFVSRLGLGLG